ncbi:hypothetical protein HYH02_002196 [Chlamydomonas schloesseri]|uniref:RAP domain-containing protein n=1 Tax=Chlamydomonas schloesseri TaxID=2026947 RepID=A0A835WUA8_9CHLO|nr:hypothetical protein HYH02_002196 [Chlamydomonas schloesseri]|eukprot:KAG2452851.1 hypothetical protein HYH02_002196 [Chlamydomonas schloesseri]
MSTQILSQDIGTGTGLLAQTVAWLQSRNRQHAPRLPLPVAAATASVATQARTAHAVIRPRSCRWQARTAPRAFLAPAPSAANAPAALEHVTADIETHRPLVQPGSQALAHTNGHSNHGNALGSTAVHGGLNGSHRSNGHSGANGHRTASGLHNRALPLPPHAPDAVLAPAPRTTAQLSGGGSSCASGRLFSGRGSDASKQEKRVAHRRHDHHRHHHSHSQRHTPRAGTGHSASTQVLNGSSQHGRATPGGEDARGPAPGCRGAALSAAIHGAASWDEMAGLYERVTQHGGGFMSGHVSAALARLPHLSGASPASPGAAAVASVVTNGHRLHHSHLNGVAVAALPGAAVPLAVNGSSGSGSGITSSSTTMTSSSSSGNGSSSIASQSLHGSGYSRHEALLAALLADFRAHMEAGAYGSRELSSCAWVLGRLGRRERAGLVEELVSRMLPAATTAAAGREEEQQQEEEDGMPNHADGVQVVGAAGQAPGASSLPMTVLDLSNAALGMARVGVTRLELWQRLAAAAAPRLRQFGTQELANLAWSFAQAHRAAARLEPTSSRHAPKQQAEDEHLSAASGLSPTPPHAHHPKWAPWLQPFVEEVVADRAQRVLRRCTAQEAANLAWALATLGHADARTVQVVAVEAEARTASLTPQAVSMMAWALATMVARMSGDGNTSHTRDSVQDSSSNEPCSADGGNQGKSVGTAKQPSPAEQASIARAAASKAATALAGVAKGRIWCYSAQGLSNLLWALRGLGCPARKSLLTAAAREAVVRLQDQLSPLGLATLLGEWAAAGLYHPGLFAAAAPLASERLADFRPATLVRLLTAFGAAGCCERQLFLSAADMLLGSGSKGVDAAAAWRAPSGRPLDGLSRGECFQLVCAYGQVGVHVPQLVDAALERMAVRPLTSKQPPSTTQPGQQPDVLELPPRTACRLAAALALLGHRPAYEAAAALGDGGAGSPAAGQALRGVMLGLRRSLLPALPALEPMAAVTAVWALMRLELAGPAAAVRLGELLVRRCGSAPSAAAAAPTGGGWVAGGSAVRGALAAAVAALTRTAAASGDGRALARLVWVLGRGAAAALQQQKQLDSGPADARPRLNGADPQQAAGAARELSSGLVAAVMVLVEERPEALVRAPETLAAAATALSDVLAAATPSASPTARARSWGGAAASASASGPAVPYDDLREALVELCETALRRAGAASAAPAHGSVAAWRGAQQQRLQLQARQQLHQQQPQQALSGSCLAEVAQAVCASGLAEQEPLLRQALARAVARALTSQVEAAAGRAAAARTAAPADVRVGDVAALLAAAARLQLLGQPSALPVLRAATQLLVAAGSAAGPRPMLCVVQLPQLLSCLRCDPAAANAPFASGTGRAPAAQAVQAALYTLLLGQAIPLLPWLPDAAAAQALADYRRLVPAASTGPAEAGGDGDGDDARVAARATTAVEALADQQCAAAGSEDSRTPMVGGAAAAHSLLDAGHPGEGGSLNGSSHRQLVRARRTGGAALLPGHSAEAALPAALHVQSSVDVRVGGGPGGTVIVVRPDGAHGCIHTSPGGQDSLRLAA